MSYIRSTSNIEGFYVFETEDKIFIKSKLNGFKIPKESFDYVVKEALSASHYNDMTFGDGTFMIETYNGYLSDQLRDCYDLVCLTSLVSDEEITVTFATFKAMVSEYLYQNFQTSFFERLKFLFHPWKYRI